MGPHLGVHVDPGLLLDAVVADRLGRVQTLLDVAGFELALLVDRVGAAATIAPLRQEGAFCPLTAV
jgi:hypothetical protein